MTLTSGICRGCRDNAGGIKKLYVVDLNGVTFPVATRDGVVEEILLEDGAKWYVLQPNKYSSSWTENINVSVENGTVGYEQVVTAVFGKNDKVLRDVVTELAKGDLVIIVVDSNDVMWLIGSEDNGAYVSGGNSASGTALTDLNGWTLNFTCMAKFPANTVEPKQGGNLELALLAADSAC